MTDKELIIKIPEMLVSELNDDNYQNIISQYATTLYDVIKNTISLPKKHGKIVDANRVLKNGYNWEVETALMQTKAIVEADTESEEETNE